MDPASVAVPLSKLQVYVVAGGLAISRTLGLMIIVPTFTRLGLTPLIRGAIAFLFGIPLIPMIVGTISPDHLPVGTIAVLVFKEVVVGIVVGLVIGVPLWAAEAAGDVLDLQRGSSIATVIDPTSANDANITGTLFELTMIALYFGSGGLLLTIRTIYDSYGVWPVGRFLPLFSEEAGGLFLALLDDVVKIGLMLVAPIVVCLLLSDLLLSLISRAAPNLHVFDLSLSVKNLVFSLLLVLYVAFLVGYMKQDLGRLLDSSPRLEVIAPPTH